MKILLVLIFIPVFLSCDSHTSYPMNSFFNKLEQSVDGGKLRDFKTASKDSIVFFFDRFNHDFFKFYKDSAQDVYLNNFFDSIPITKYPEDKRLYFLCFAFHSYLNGKQFNNDELIKEVKDERLKRLTKWENKMKLLDLENYHIMQTNDKRWGVGDLIKIILPVEFKEGTKSARYYNNYYASLDPFGFVDSLKINAKILEKRYLFSDDSIKTDTAHIIFKLKITKLNHPDYKIFNKKLGVGDTLDLYLKAYCRYIY